MNCNHNWKLKEGATKERCIKCGAARVYDPSACRHDYVWEEGKLKERCSKCGAARVHLAVKNIENKQSASEVK